MENKINTFQLFYNEIKNHFQNNSEEYKTFESNVTTKEKIAYILTHPIVRNRMETLLNWNVRPRDKPENNDTHYQFESYLNPKSKIYPHLTVSAKSVFTTKRGRHLIATKRIDPGNSNEWLCLQRGDKT